MERVLWFNGLSFIGRPSLLSAKIIKSFHISKRNELLASQNVYKVLAFHLKQNSHCRRRDLNESFLFKLETKRRDWSSRCLFVQGKKDWRWFSSDEMLNARAALSNLGFFQRFVFKINTKWIADPVSDTPRYFRFQINFENSRNSILLKSVKFLFYHQKETIKEPSWNNQIGLRNSESKLIAEAQEGRFVNFVKYEVKSVEFFNRNNFV